VARKRNSPQDQPVLVIDTEIRLYQWEPELLAYFHQFKRGQYATAIKRAVRVALNGGDLGLNLPASGGAKDSEADPDDLNGFVG
jgi:hypothetical protein